MNMVDPINSIGFLAVVLTENRSNRVTKGKGKS